MTAALETIPGGAASFIGHLIAVPIVVGTGITIAGKGVWPMILLIAAFALPLLIAFEYRSLTRMGQIRSAGLRLWVALWQRRPHDSPIAQPGRTHQSNSERKLHVT